LYAAHVELFLRSYRAVNATKREFYDALRAAIEELEIELQACKETLDD
jgi:hypothetical protein